MMRVRVGQLAGAHEGATVTIVGKGPTLFDYAELRHADGPVIFLNDAVQFERHLRPGTESYFFCHHQHQAAHLTEHLRSVAVLPARDATGSTGKPLISADTGAASQVHRLATYHWHDGWRQNPEWVGRLDRKHIADEHTLFIGPGVILPAIHFAWLTGASRVRFIGCDGFAPPEMPPEMPSDTTSGGAYDPRIDLSASGSRPGDAFARIRQWQDWLGEQLELAVDYVREARLDPLIPPHAFFIWIGPRPLPDQAKRNIDAFQGLHPDWRVDLITQVPGNTPPPLRLAITRCQQWCQVSDLVSYWLLFRHGGVYLDCDVVPLRPIDRLTHFRAWASRQYNQRGELWNINCAAMGSAKHGEAMRCVLQRAETIGAERTAPKRRAAYGPDLLSELFEVSSVRPWGTDNGLSVLPAHWWQPFSCPPRNGAGETAGFAEASAAEQWCRIGEVSERFTDPTDPYGVHTFEGSHDPVAESETVA